MKSANIYFALPCFLSVSGGQSFPPFSGILSTARILMDTPLSLMGPHAPHGLMIQSSNTEKLEYDLKIEAQEIFHEIQIHFFIAIT